LHGLSKQTLLDETLYKKFSGVFWSQKNMDWSKSEVVAIVEDYIKMLSLELSGQSYNKSAHRAALQLKLNGRTNGSIEFKHGNISAVMIELGFPYIKGYQPRNNFQGLLLEVVGEQLKNISTLDSVAQAAVLQPAIAPVVQDFKNTVVTPPTRQYKVSDAVSSSTSYNPVKRDYLAQEARNQSLGLAGEEFILQYEHWRLVSAGHQKLADRVEHVSKTKGDGLGYDILSFDLSGRERFLEVKTTSFGKETPFFVSNRELKFSEEAEEQFHLVRVFEFRKAPRLFSMPGSVRQHCMLDPVSYKASFS